MSVGQRCVDCRIPTPETATAYTLMSVECGWRLSRRQLKDGASVLEWRCPSCWRAFKASPETKAQPKP